MKFNCTNYLGKQIDIPTPTRDTLVAVVNDSMNPRRDEAARILKHYEAVANKPVPTELDKSVQLQLAEIDADAVWCGLARFETQMGSDGVERQQVIWNHLG